MATTSVLLTELRRISGTSSLTKKAIQSDLKNLESKIVEYDEKIQKLEYLASELATMKLELEAERIKAERLTAAYDAEYQKFLDSKDEYEKLQKKTTASYSTEDVSSFLNKMINDFNTSNASDTDVAKYIINNMDVDLKVRVFDDSKGNGEKSFKFTAPSINETSEDSLSSIKITIQAVPK